MDLPCTERDRPRNYDDGDASCSMARAERARTAVCKELNARPEPRHVDDRAVVVLWTRR